MRPLAKSQIMEEKRDTWSRLFVKVKATKHLHAELQGLDYVAALLQQGSTGTKHDGSGQSERCG